MTDHVDLIARFEGFAPEPYWDYHQWSIGYGSYAGSRDRNQRPNITVSQSEARNMLRQQLSRYEANVDGYNSRYNWTPNERAALISFAYNIGSIDGLTANGTRSKAEISRKILEYNKAGGQTLDGLVRRRQAEHTLFGGGSPELPPEGTVGVDSGGNTSITEGVTGAGATGVANVTNDFAAANNTADLWQIAEQSGNFWDNELDVYDYYTYQLEFFVVDELATIKFMTDGYDLDAVSKDGWPDAETRRITIAMTGGSTEFNVQDLNVESLGTGSSSGSRISGTAIGLSFNIIQVGNTSLNDSLQNAAVLMGYSSIHDATWYMKVNFIGYVNDQPKKLEATKVLPFKISDFGDLQTSTDARGTSTILNGRIILQKSFDSDINTIKYSFEFDIKDTLRDTLTEFFEKLNKKISDNNFSGDQKYINKYDFITDPTIEEYLSSAMNGPNPNLSSASNRVGRTSGQLNIAQQVGTVSPGANVFNIVTDIVNQSLKMREAMTEPQDSFSDILSITPVAVQEPEGLNVLTNTRGHKVTYHLGIRRVVLYQNQIDSATKAQNSAKMIDEIFTQGRCRKRYYYQYTGLNDQVLDFQVSLNKQLTKAYVAPTDEFAFANFVSGAGTGPLSLDALNETAKAELTRVRGEQDTLTTQLADAQQQLDGINNQVEQLGKSLQQDLVDRFNANNRQPGMGDENVDSLFSDPDNFQQTLRDIESFEEGSDVITPEIRQRIDRLREQQASANNALTAAGGKLAAAEARADDIVRQGFGAILSDQTREAIGRGSDNFDLISPEIRADNSFVLIEALDSDFVTNLRTEEMNSLIQTLIDSPMVFERTILTRLRDVNRSGVFRSSDQEDIEIARQRYYEGLNADLSMQELTITIKGDPFWLNNYIPPDKAREYFGAQNTNDRFRNDNVNYNGFQYVMIITNKAAGTDDLMNIKIANLRIDVYQVKRITSSFSGGLFTQTLEMIKKNFPENFKALNPSIDAEFMEFTGGSATSPGELGDGLRGNGASGNNGTNTGDSTGVNTGIGGSNSQGQNGDGDGDDEVSEDANLANENDDGGFDGPPLPEGDFTGEGATGLFNGDIPLVNQGSKFNRMESSTGRGTRTINTQIPPNTLTAPEMEQAVAIQKELKSMIAETPLMQMTDTEYARAKSLEGALENIVDNATTGVRGEIRDEIINRENRNQLAESQSELAEVEDELDGWYLTTRGREADEELREQLKQQVLEQQATTSPDVMTDVQRVVNPDTGEVDVVPIYSPSKSDGEPIRIPKPAPPLPMPHIDNGDGTITVEGPPTPPVNIPDETLDAIDATSLSEEQKQEYYEALASNNGIKVNRFIETLSPEQQEEIRELQNPTATKPKVVPIIGETVDRSVIPAGDPLEKVSDEQLRQMQAAKQIYDNVINQINELPTVQVTENLNGEIITFDIPDTSKLQPITYINDKGETVTLDLRTETVNGQQIIGEYGWTAGSRNLLKDFIVQDYDQLIVGNGKSEQNASGKLQTEINAGFFGFKPQFNAGDTITPEILQKLKEVGITGAFVGEELLESDAAALNKK